MPFYYCVKLYGEDLGYQWVFCLGSAYTVLLWMLHVPHKSTTQTLLYVAIAVCTHTPIISYTNMQLKCCTGMIIGSGLYSGIQNGDFISFNATPLTAREQVLPFLLHWLKHNYFLLPSKYFTQAIKSSHLKLGTFLENSDLAPFNTLTGQYSQKRNNFSPSLFQD